MWPIVRSWDPHTPHEVVQQHHHQLRDLIHQLQEQHPGTKLGVGGSWSSPKLAITDDCPLSVTRSIILTEVIRLHGFVQADICYWANVLRFGDALEPHNHERSHLGGDNDYAAVYYLTAGAITFMLPKTGLSWDKREVNARPGMLLFFPATLNHCVAPYFGETPRLTFAFNIKLKRDPRM